LRRPKFSNRKFSAWKKKKKKKKNKKNKKNKKIKESINILLLPLYTFMAGQWANLSLEQSE
jgi:hypothetical protein